ncbi:MAG: hypothetical protein P1U65_11595 [Minwuia sp.]|nr:hypothetical protein [Minwuia sp.]
MIRTLLQRTCLATVLVALSFSLLSVGNGVGAEEVRVRFGDHPGFSRMVFDWPEPSGYAVNDKGDVVDIVFDRPGDFDLTAFQTVGARAISSVDVLQSGRIVRLELANARLGKHFVAGGKVVLDLKVLAGSVPAPTRKPVTAPSTKPPPAQTRTTAQAKPRPSLREPAKQAERPTASRTVKSGTARANVARAQGDMVPVSYDLRPGRTIMRFHWPRRVPAVAVHRGEHVWLAFGDDLTVDPGPEGETAQGPVERVVTEPSATGSVVRIDVAAGAALSVTVDGNDWVVDIGGGRGRAETAVWLEAQADAPSGPRVFAAIANAAEPILIDDPVVGDRLALVPVMEAGLGVHPARRYVLFDLPPTQQGIAVRFHAEALKIVVDDRGLAIGGRDTLFLASESSGGKGQGTGGPPGITGGDNSDAPYSVFDLSMWQEDVDVDETRQDLMYRIAVATPAARNGERLALARFLVGHRLAQEALGVMHRIEAEDKYADTDPAYRALRGVARLFAGKLGEAAGDLRHPKLAGAQDVALFRGLLAVKRREYQEARREFLAGLPTLSKMPAEMQPDLRLAFAETALAQNDPKMAGEQISALLKHAGTESRREEAKLLAARIHALTGDVEDAAALFAELAESPYRPVRAQAVFAETNLLLDEKRIETDEAIERLERLRFAWRGDVFEFELMQRLASLYVEAGQYRKGMMSMRQTVERFPDMPEAQALAGEMKEVFASLFEEGQSSEMSPVTAMALYYEFRELTPDGARGDRMIRRLADRLAAVELLGEASKLLEHQVLHRLRGEEKARVGTRLAVLNLLDGRPDDAIEALRNTRTLSMREDLQRERLLLESRALTEVGKYDRALVLISGLQGQDVADVRTEILWRARKWGRAAVSLAPKLVALRQDANPLAQDARRDILRFAIASSLAGDRTALLELRRSFADRMKGQPEWPAFQVVTAEDRRDSAEFRNLAAEIAQVDQFEAFMTSYRDRLRDRPLSAIN